MNPHSIEPAFDDDVSESSGVYTCRCIEQIPCRLDTVAFIGHRTDIFLEVQHQLFGIPGFSVSSDSSQLLQLVQVWSN